MIQSSQVWVVTDNYDRHCVLLVLCASREHPSRNGMLYKCLALDSWGRDIMVPWLHQGAISEWHELWFYDKGARRLA